MHVTDEEHPATHLARAGLQPRDVHAVVVTPLQNYATGNLDLFPHARLCFSRRGWVELMAPRYRPHPHDVPRFCFPPRVLTHIVTTPWDRVHLLEDEDQIAPGVGTFWVGCHHRSSLAVRVQTAQGVVLLTDCCFLYGNLERPHPLGINENLYECLDAYARIRREADLVVPLYDPEVFRRHPNGLIS